jgi:dTDP-4-dehydrorhamnose reductase
MKAKKHRILILGASGFLGHSIYKELAPYYKTFGTYHKDSNNFKSNKHFYKYSLESDDVVNLIESLKPSLIISALKGPFPAQVTAHRHIYEHLKDQSKIKILFLSSANVFDAYSKYPSYENDTRLSNSIYGHLKIRIEHQLQKLPKQQWAILRLPMVFGLKSHRIQEIKQLHQLEAAIELFPNLVMNVCSADRMTRQLHYIINRNKNGIFHCGSTDLVHHEDFIKDLTGSLGIETAKYKFVYTTNNERYLAVLPKYNALPKYLQFKCQDVLNELFKTP